MNKIVALPLFLGLIGISLLIAKLNQNDPFVYVCLLWFFVCLFGTAKSKHGLLRLSSLCAGSAVLTFGVMEAYLAGWFPGQRHRRLHIAGAMQHGGFYQSLPILGYGPKKGIQVSASAYYGDLLLYDVIYTIDRNGLRVGPTSSESARVPSVLFLGGSFTFGSGVNDNETMPYVFEEKSQGRFKAFNFGFIGYGPHQMLAILENKLEMDIVRDNAPVFGVYQAIPDHVAEYFSKLLQNGVANSPGL